MSNLQRIQPPVFPVEKVEIPEAESFRLKNGVPVFLIESGTEDIMRLEFTFAAGHAKEHIPLLSSATSMMLSEGSQNYNAEELNKQLDFYGIFLHSDTDRDRAEIVLFLLNRHIGKALELSREIIFRPVFPESELKALMKKRQRWFQVNREKVGRLAEDKYFETIFGRNHPYGYRIAEKDFDNINRELLKEFHSRYYVPDNMAVIISGRIHESTRDLLNDFFGEMPAKGFKNHNGTDILKSDGTKKHFVEKEGAIQTAIRIGSPAITKRHPDYPGFKVLDTILGGYFGSRLMKNIREDKGYTYGIHSGIYSLNLSGYKMISTEVGKDNYRKAIDEIYKEIKLLQDIPVEREEMNIVRNYMSGEMLRMFDGPFALAESFKSVWEFGLDNNYYHRLAETIRKIDPDEITQLARTYYNIDELYEVTAGAK